MPDDPDYDFDETLAEECDVKLADFEDAQADYDADCILTQQVVDDAAEAERLCDEAFTDRQQTKTELDTAREMLTTNEDRIPEIDARIAEIDAALASLEAVLARIEELKGIDPAEEIAKRLPSLMGDSTEHYDPANNEPWNSIEYYEKLLRELEALEANWDNIRGAMDTLMAERESLVTERSERTTAAERIPDLEVLLEALNEEQSQCATERAEAIFERTQALERNSQMFQAVRAAQKRYANHGCGPITGEIEEPERWRPARASTSPQ